ncbi:MAG: magnesium transporter MgtC [Candidatus Diapherotrites archaeon CG08_land_8_20_14_0_20_34_12]|nr:MAG: magnesium transporter MgtC [Candidatus Diapherotrites archaeon CG08_land_8_20_14_0_20_34_12]
MLSESELIWRLSLSLIVGIFFGLERELSKRGQGYAGLRTHALVALGSTVFTLASLSFEGNVDPSRIAAGIVTGVGFLGAGVIYKGQNYVKGLTTAANIWTVSAIGMVIGMGLYTIAAYATGLSIIVLILGKFFEKKVLKEEIDEDGEVASFNL